MNLHNFKSDRQQHMFQKLKFGRYVICARGRRCLNGIKSKSELVSIFTPPQVADPKKPLQQMVVCCGASCCTLPKRRADYLMGVWPLLRYKHYGLRTSLLSQTVLCFAIIKRGRRGVQVLGSGRLAKRSGIL